MLIKLLLPRCCTRYWGYNWSKTNPVFEKLTVIKWEMKTWHSKCYIEDNLKNTGTTRESSILADNWRTSQEWLYWRMRWGGGKSHPGRVQNTFKGSEVSRELLWGTERSSVCLESLSWRVGKRGRGKWREMMLEREGRLGGLSKPVKEFRISLRSNRQPLKQWHDYICIVKIHSGCHMENGPQRRKLEVERPTERQLP